MENEQRAEQLIKKYGFDFDDIPKKEIRNLKNGGVETEYVRPRREVMESFITYYANYFAAEDE